MSVPFLILNDSYSCPADARALTRLAADHVSRTLVPAFYRFLQAQDESDQIEHGKAYHAALEELGKLLERVERESEPDAKGRLGLWEPSGEFGWVDAMVGPCQSLTTLLLFRAF
jgi:glutathione S-transferase